MERVQWPYTHIHGFLAFINVSPPFETFADSSGAKESKREHTKTRLDLERSKMIGHGLEPWTACVTISIVDLSNIALLDRSDNQLHQPTSYG